MKTSLLIAVILVVVVVAGAVAYLAISMNEGPQSALLNAKRLFSRNVTVTYDFVIGSTFMINNIVQGVPNVPFPSGPLMGIITISRTPVDDAMVINGTLAIRHYIGVGINFGLALWRYGNEYCYAIAFNFMGQQTEAHCVPYINLTKYVVLTLNESKYIGEGSWNGKTTYCFTASMSLKPNQGELQGVPMVINVTEICLLSNGVPTNITMYIYPARQGMVGNVLMNINMTLINYSFTFNQNEFSQITRGLVP